MGDINKRYVIGVGADKKSLEQLKIDLNNAIKEPFNKIGKDNQIHGLSRSDKAAIKADLSELFGIADEQAEALRKMVQGIIPTDSKGIDKMKSQLQDTLKFATGIMEQMKLISDSTDWMKQGVSFVDKFTGLQGTLAGTQQVVAEIKTTVDDLTKSFGEFKNALAVTNPDAFAKRFGQAAKSGTHVDANIKAIAKEMTDAAERASLKIQDVIADLEDEGIKIAVTLPDPDAAEFAAQINNFVKKASDQFKKNPIKLDVELLDPFKNGVGDKLTKNQKKLAEQSKEVAKNAGFSDESLIGLDSPDTSRIVRHIIDSFINIQKAVKDGQKGITDATKKWRQDISNELTLKAKFDNLDIKSEAAALMQEVQAFLNEHPPLFIDVDIDNFIDSLQEALKETVLTVNVKADNIDGNGAVLNLTGTKIASGNKVDTVQDPKKIINQPQATTHAVNATNKNSEAVNESTRVQNVLKDAISQLNKSIDIDAQRIKTAEEENAKRAEEAKKNADKIAEYNNQIEQTKEHADNISDARRRSKEKIPALEQKSQEALKAYSSRVKTFNDAVKNEDIKHIQKEYDWAVDYLYKERQETVEHIEEVRSRVDDRMKDKTLRYYNNALKDIDSLLDNKDKQEDFILQALQHSYRKENSEINQEISGWMNTIELQGKQIAGSNENIDYYNQEIERLSKEVEIARSERGIQSKQSHSKNQQQRRDNIQSILDSNQSPVQLVFDELKEFWEKSYRTIEKTKSELDNLKNGNYSDDLKTKLSDLTEDDQKAMVQGLISQKEKRISDWTARQSLMSQRGFGDWTKGANLDDVLKSFTVESLTDVLSKSSTISDDLLSNSSLKGLSSIKEIAYYASVAQDALGFKTQTSQEYVDEKTLQARLMELARIKTFTDKVQGMFPKNSGTPELQGIESFIEFFEKLNVTKETITSIVERAKDKIGSIQEGLIGVSEGSTDYQNKQLDINRLQGIIDSPLSALDAAKDYLESFKNFAKTIEGDKKFTSSADGKSLTASQMAQVIWDGMDTTVRDSVTKAMLSSSEFAGVKELNQVSIVGILDKMTKVFETGALKDITSEDKSYQQLVALLDRQSKFQRAKIVSDLQYGGSLKGSLYDARTPDKPIYVKVVGSHGEESVYDVHKPQKGGADSDRSFSTNSKGLERFFKHLGVTEQVEEIVSAMFNDSSLAQTLTDKLFEGKNISLSTKPFTRTASRAYGFADSPLGKNLNDQERLTKEIGRLESGEYSQWILKSIDGLSGDARTAKIQEIISNKKAELESLKQLEFSEEEINQSLIALMSDVETGKAQAKDARRSLRHNTNRATNLLESGKSDWAYNTRQNSERTAAKRAADMIRSGTRGTSQNLENPLQQIIDRVRVASQYGLMNTTEIEQILANYDKAYTAARNMPRIKDAGTPIDMFDSINDAWKEEERLRNQVFDMFFGSDGWYATQVVTDQISAIEGELSRKEQSITSNASSVNSTIESQIADINANEAKAKQDADAYATKLYDKYLKEPEEEIQAELRRRSSEIEAKAKQTQDAKNNLVNLADRDTELNKLKTDLYNQMQQDTKYVELTQQRRSLTAGSPKHQRYTQEIQEIENKYTAEYNKARQKWIESKSAELDAEYDAFVKSIEDSAVGDASKNAVSKFNKDFKGQTTSKRTISGIKKFIESEKQRMYQEAEHATQQAMGALDMSNVVSQESINKDIEKARKDAEKKRKNILKSVKKKSDAELMAEGSYGQAAMTASADVERLKEQNKKNESLLNDLLAQYGRTKEMLNAERGIYESSQDAQTALQQQLSNTDQSMYGGQGGGYLGSIDTSHLATEATLRGIYTLLNGAPPEGGWGNDEATKNKALAFGRDESAEAIAKSIRSIINQASIALQERAWLIGDRGQVGDSIIGNNSGISSKAVNDEIAKHIGETIRAIFHNHPYTAAAGAHLSDSDIESSYKMAYGSSRNIKMTGSIFRGTMSLIDWSRIQDTKAAEIMDNYRQLIAEKTKHLPDHVGIDSDPKIQRELSNIYNECIRKVLSDAGHADAFQQFDISNIKGVIDKIVQATQEQIALSIFNASADGVVDATKQSAKQDTSTLQTQLQTSIGKLKTLSDAKTSGASRAHSGLNGVLHNLSSGREKLREKELRNLGTDYHQLVETINHELFKTLDEDVQQSIIAAKDYALDVLTKHNVRVYGSDELTGKLITEDNKSLFALKGSTGANTYKKVGKYMSNLTKPALERTYTGKDGQEYTRVIQAATGHLSLEQQITREKQNQNKLASDAVHKEEQVTTNVEERANAEKKANKNKSNRKSADNKTPTPVTSGDSTPSGGGKQGGFLGALNRIAQEDTLQSIASLLSKGIKTTSGDGESGGKKGEKPAITSETAEAEIMSYIKSNYPEFTSIGKLKSTANGYSVDITTQRTKEIAKVQEEINRLEAEGKTETQEYANAQARLNGLKKEQEKITLRISNVDGQTQITEKKALENLAIGTKAAAKELQFVDDMMSRLHSAGAISVGGDGDITSSNAAITNYINSLRELMTYQNSLTEKELLDPATEQRLSELSLATQNYRKEVTLLLNAVDQYNSGDNKGILSGVFGNETDIKTTMQSWIAENNKLVTSFGKLTPVYKNNQVVAYQLEYTMRTGKKTVQDMTASLNPLTHELTIQSGAVREVDTGWGKFFHGLKSKWTSIIQYMASITQITDMIRYVRTGVQYVREIDSALTELKKVTDETDASYAKFLQDMSKTGSVIGATVKDLTSSAADWARLGYNIQEAGELAKNTSILMNVSEFEDVNKATDTLISALQAFKKEGQDVGQFSMEIIDKYNEVGNNYAISTSDLADSLTRSSAALVAANNSLEQSIALTAAANTTIQDPESVGNALKTVSMRIRGVKTELESAGEDTEGMVVNTAKLQEKIMALTNIDGSGGINILTESGDFKSTYDILLAISKVWKEMDDTSQAALLELIAGKTRGSVVAALFQNGDVLEEAYNSATGASGSAMNELDTYLQSIQGHIDQFNDSLQTMWMNALDTDAVKWFVHLGKLAIDLADKLGLIPTVLGAITGFNLAKSFLDAQSGMLSTRQQIKELIKMQHQEKVATQQNTAEKTKNTTASKTNAAAKDVEEQQTRELTTEVNANTQAYINNNAARSGQSVGTTGSQAGGIVGVIGAGGVGSKATSNAIKEGTQDIVEDGVEAGMQGAADNLTNNGGKTGLTAIFSGLFSKLGSSGIGKVFSKLAGSAFGKIIGSVLGGIAGSIIASLAFDLIVNPLMDWMGNLFKSAEQKAQDLAADVEEITTKYQEAKKNFDDNLKTLTTSSDAKLYATLQDEFAELTRGVDKYGNNISLTSDQYERYKEICEQIVGINPKIASGYDSATKAIGNNVDVLQQLIELQEMQARANVRSLLTDENIDDIATGAWYNVKNAKQSYETAKSSLDAQRIAIDRDVAEKFQQSDFVKYFNPKEDSGYNAMLVTLQKLGYSFEEAQNEIQEKYASRGVYNSVSFFSDYMHDIYKNVDKFNFGDDNLVADFFAQLQNDGLDYGKSLESYNELNADVESYQKKLVESQDNLIDTLLQVPYGEFAYDKLGNLSKSLITEWIKSSELFKIDPDAYEKDIQEQLKSNIETIRNLVNQFNNEAIQAAVNEFDNLDSTKLTDYEYGDKIHSIAFSVWEAIGRENNQFGFKSIGDIKDLFGFDYNQEIQKMTDVLNILSNYLDKSHNDILKRLNRKSMSRAEMEAFLGIDWNAIGAENVKNIDDVWKIIRNAIRQSASEPVKTYSVLSESMNSYSDALKATAEIVMDNTLVTQEYKDSLVELGITEQELAECFDEGNPLVVKNAKALNDLVKSTKSSVAKNTQLAKSQARLQYYELYKEIDDLTNGIEVTDAATLDYIDSLYDQMGALEKTIAKYSILEAKLLRAASAYDLLADAQAVDEEFDYGSKAEEMLKVLGDAINSGQLGTEAAQVALKGLVPETELIGATPDEMMDNAYKYLTSGPISTLFTIETDDDGMIQSVEMTQDNLKNFINNSDAFIGTWDNFTLDPTITSIDELAARMNTTKEVAFAMLTELEKYDISWLGGNYDTLMDQLMGSDLEYQLNKRITELADIAKKIAYGTATDEEKEKYVSLQGEVDTLSQHAADQATIWSRTSDALQKCQDRMINLNKELEEAKKSGDDYSGRSTEEIEADIKAAQEECNTLLGLLDDIGGQPTEYTLQLASDKVDKDMVAFKKSLEENATGEPQSVNLRAAIQYVDDTGFESLGLERGPNGEWIGLAELECYTKLDEAGKREFEAYLDMAEDKHYIDILSGDGIVSVEEHLGKIVEILEKTYELLVETNVDDEPVQSFVDWLSKTPLSKTVSFVANTVGSLWDKITGGNNSNDNKKSDANGTANVNGTAYKGGSWGAPKTETALTGELGPELLVRGDKWHLVGENGTEFTDVKKGDIIFNHKQTESLLKNGHIAGRGKAYAGGTTKTSGAAYAQMFGTSYAENEKLKKELKESTSTTAASNLVDSLINGVKSFVESTKTTNLSNAQQASGSINTWNNNSTLGGSSGSGSGDSDNEFEETLDWIEVRMEELEETLSKLNAELENAVGYVEKNNKIDAIIAKNREKYADSKAGAEYYENYADKFWNDIPEEYREWAKNGAIEISDFAGDANEATVEAIQKYREYIQKAADLSQQTEEIITEIRDLAIQRINNAYEHGDIRATVEDSQTNKLQNAVKYDEDRGLITSDAYYVAMMENSNKKIKYLTEARKAMQEELDTAVQNGEVVRGSNEWYELLDQMYQVDAQIDEATIELEEFQNAINDIYWDNFDQLINRLDYLKDETQSLIDLMDHEDMVISPETEDGWSADQVEWTKEGLASLGLYAQQMEIAEYKSKQYAEAIDDLTKEYEAGHYSENEYLEKLEELKSAQYDSIEAYHDAQDAIKQLQEARVDEIKKGIEKQVKAYEKLIEKQKEALDSEKDLYDFQKSMSEQSKNIAEIERKLAALANDTSMSAMAKKRQLEAELAEAKAEQEELYYNRSIDKQQEALDKELEDFQEQKDAEIEKWDEYLTNIETLVAESLGIVQTNADAIGQTLTDKATEYNLTVSDAILSPWKDGALAVSDYQTVFDTAMSSTTNQLDALKNKWQEVIDKMAEVGEASVDVINKENANYAAATKKEPEQPSAAPSTQPETETEKPAPTLSVGSYVEVKPGTRWYSDSYGGGAAGNARSGKIKYINTSGSHAYNIDGLGWIKKTDIQGYAKGTTDIKKDQLAQIDELGEEIIMHAQNGKLAYLTKGSSVIPHDISENLMQLGQLDPSNIIDQNRPQIGVHPEIHNTEINLSITYGDMVSIGEYNGGDVKDLEKMVAKQFDKHTKDLNNAIRKYVR